MKLNSLSPWLISIALLWGFFNPNTAEAVTFGQQEVNQSDFIAIARPYGQNKYDLLILRQIPGKRQCWQEQGGNPVLVKPLLLNFDFTGSCERSTDSNGYSIRIDGQDYGLNYLLRIVERNGELVLVATHREDMNQPEIVVGRTQGLAQGFMKINLDPGWRFTKRIYKGKTLGHVYLTGDSSAIRSPASSSETVATLNNNLDTSENTQTNSVREYTFTSQGTSVNSRNSAPSSRSSLPSLPSPRNSSSTSSNLPVPPSPSSSSRFSDLPPLPVPPQVNQSSIVPPPNSSGRQSLSQVVSGLSTPQGGTATSVSGYRVLVSATSNYEKAQVKGLYPDAFPTVYQGRSLWQIGLFSTRQNAEKALRGFENRGINGIIIP